MTTAKFIYDVPYNNMDMYYAIGFLCFDPIGFFQIKNKRYIVIDELEYGRAVKQSKVDKVLLSTTFLKGAEIRKGNVVELMNLIFKKFKIKTLEVPVTFPYVLAESFKNLGYKITLGSRPFFMDRCVKTAKEKAYMLNIQKKNFKLIGFVENVLREAKVKNNKLFLNGKVLTTEQIIKWLKVEAINLGCTIESPIVACDQHSIDPHSSGAGPILPHKSIVVDIFPRDEETLYFGDATRTFCKGQASDELHKQYNDVKAAQEMALKKIKNGINGKDIHQEIVSFFETKGYKTGVIDGTIQGFFHGTGHGIGLELHENPPNIGARDCTLKAGYVTSVEPGLYYKKVGGVRIEDLVYVTKNGCEIFGFYPKKLEIA